jgi:formimidoylglutamate deiminase
MTCILQADLTLLDGRLEQGVVVHVGREGRITKIVRDDRSLGGAAEAIEERPPIDESQPGEFGSPRARRKTRLRNRLLVPGFVNGHSRAFQRLLRGRADLRAAGEPESTFWSWTTGLYRVTEALSPDDVETVSALAFMEMLRAGFTHVVEFQTLHHNPGGAPYDDPAELSARVLAAADFAGIGVTLLRAALQRGGADTPPIREQRRFVDPTPEDYLARLEATKRHVSSDGRRPVRLGLAAASVQGLDDDYLRALARHGEATGMVLHAPVASREALVQQCLDERGCRPMEHLADCGLLSERFTAVHATWLDEAEADLLGGAGGRACLCPSAERSVARGLPDVGALRRAGVELAIGTGSQARIDPFAELLGLDSSERLRATEASDGGAAPHLLAAGAEGGAGAAGLDAGHIAEGRRADLVALDLDDPALAGLATTPDAGEVLVAALVGGGHPRLVRDVWVGGRQVVTDGVMLRWEAAVEAYRKVARRIWA